MANRSPGETRLLDFLYALATNPKLLATYRQNPVQAMEKAGLSEAEQTKLLSQDPAQIAAAFAGELVEV